MSQWPSDPRERLMLFVRKDESGCWHWQGARKSTGYGQTSLNGVGMNAHRAMYLAIHGPVAQGMDIDHLCGVRHCVNPDHLEAVPHVVNVQRQRVLLSDYCRKGHLRSAANVRWERDGHRMRRRCRVCERERESRRQRRRGGPGRSGAKLTWDQVERIREMHRGGMKQIHIAPLFAVTPNTVGLIVRGVTWNVARPAA